MTQSGLGGGPHLLRLMNCAAVLQAIRDAGTARLTDVVQATGLSRPTVTAAVSTLIGDGWVEETEAPESDLPRMGRPARVVRFRADARHVLGIDVGPHKVYCAVADLNGNVVTHIRRDVDEPGSYAALLEHVDSTMDLVLDEAGVDRSSLAAVGIGTPGIVDEYRGAVVQAPSVPGWDSLELSRALQDGIPCPVHVENDVNLAVVAERWNGRWGDADDLVLVQWGYRVGAAVLMQGRLHRGAHGAAGEIGFIDLEEEPQGVQAEGLGPLEATAGTSWIFRRARELGDHTSRDAVTVLSAAARGDPLATRVVDEAAARFARGLAPFLAAIDPELVVIGGGITLAGETMLSAVRSQLARRALVVPRLELSSLGDDAVALGAVRLALDHAERRLLDAYSAPDAKM
ncbi:putative NBD/HSP70 family sugar kinase [Haloactinopolyspora alba]|uniref:Putative NBD/HSP70 family sugar kinase n=1 Tax=Haloactinopolyspora alba TaxID=648780 RepID=A0A2P8E2N1_9ACTN|nr:ROK family transcriptional regulator [Haloactinopolyspora alba]PSL03706.1 putative NBD/HSP70 family sugar kinase [Haloactinopolyspora alba]